MAQPRAVTAMAVPAPGMVPNAAARGRALNVKERGCAACAYKMSELLQFIAGGRTTARTADARQSEPQDNASMVRPVVVASSCRGERDSSSPARTPRPQKQPRGTSSEEERRVVRTHVQTEEETGAARRRRVRHRRQRRSMQAASLNQHQCTNMAPSQTAVPYAATCPNRRTSRACRSRRYVNRRTCRCRKGNQTRVKDRLQQPSR